MNLDLCNFQKQSVGSNPNLPTTFSSKKSYNNSTIDAKAARKPNEILNAGRFRRGSRLAVRVKCDGVN